MQWESTSQERIGGFLIQFEVYRQPGQALPYKVLAYHGPRQVAQAAGKTPTQARQQCREAYLATETTHLKTHP